MRSVLRALNLIEVLAAAGRPLTLSELGARADLPSSTAHHLLGTLVARGYARHDTKSREYAVGTRLAELASRPVNASEWMPLALPAVHALNSSCGEAVHLAEMRGYELITLLKLDSLHAVRVDTGALVKSHAAHATATGKALIAHWRPEQVAQYLDHVTLCRFTPQTITDATRLAAELARVRRAGVADDVEEFQPGVHCIGAPVRAAGGAVVAAISCSMPSMRANRRYAAHVRQLVRDSANEISRRLGHRPTEARSPQSPEPSYKETR